MRKPISDPLPMGPAERLQSWRLGSRSQNLGVGRTWTSPSPCFMFSRESRTSLIPKSPIIRGTMSIPDWRFTLPKVKRGIAVIASWPTVAKSRPQDDHHQGAGHRAAGEKGDQGEGQKDQGKDLGGAELQGKLRQRRGDEHQGDDADGPGDEGGEGGDPEGRPGPALGGSSGVRRDR